MIMKARGAGSPSTSTPVVVATLLAVFGAGALANAQTRSFQRPLPDAPSERPPSPRLRLKLLPELSDVI
jgi:hypothetical protein